MLLAIKVIGLLFATLFFFCLNNFKWNRKLLLVSFLSEIHLNVTLSPTYIENGMSEFIKGLVYFASLYGTLRDPHLWGVLRRLGQDGRINPAAAPRGRHLSGTTSRTLSPVIYLRLISRLILHPRQWLKNVIYMTRIKIMGS